MGNATSSNRCETKHAVKSTNSCAAGVSQATGLGAPAQKHQKHVQKTNDRLSRRQRLKVDCNRLIVPSISPANSATRRMSPSRSDLCLTQNYYSNSLSHSDREDMAQIITDSYKQESVISSGFETPSESGYTQAFDPIKLSLPETIAEEDRKTEVDKVLSSPLLGEHRDYYVDPQHRRAFFEKIATLNKQLNAHHKEFVVPFQALNQVMSGGVYCETELKREDHHRIEALLRCHIDRECVPLEVAQWIQLLCEMRITVELRPIDIADLFPSMKSLLSNQCNQCNQFVDLDAVVSVFPNCQRLSVIGGFQLDMHAFDAVLEMLTRKDCPLRLIQFYGDEKSVSDRVKSIAVGVYAAKLRKIGWSMTWPYCFGTNWCENMERSTTLRLQKR